jgi:hypothetical protein
MQAGEGVVELFEGGDDDAGARRVHGGQLQRALAQVGGRRGEGGAASGARRAALPDALPGAAQAARAQAGQHAAGDHAQVARAVGQRQPLVADRRRQRARQRGGAPGPAGEHALEVGQRFVALRHCDVALADQVGALVLVEFAGRGEVVLALAERLAQPV